MASARKTKSNAIPEFQLQLLYGDDSRFKYWESHLFNEVYLRRDLPEKHSAKWENSESVEFQHFMNTLRNLAAEYKDREKELLNWSETETINNWVKHVLDALGWKNNCTGVQNPFLEETSFRYDGKTYRTDILIVDHPKEKQYINEAKGDDKLVEARNSVIMPVEVKYWQRLEEFRQGRHEQKKRQDAAGDDLERTATPNEQAVQYMKILKKDWGILTDGARWRIFNSELSGEDANRFYEFNLYSLINSMNTEATETDRIEVREAAKYFYHFFSKETFYSKEEGEESFVGEILRYSKKYVNKVEEDLRDRFVRAMNIACNGFLRTSKRIKMKLDPETIRNLSESVLFNILFIKSLESRGVLPMNSTDYRKISLSSTIDKIEKFDPYKDSVINARELLRSFAKGNGNSFQYKADGFELHDRIVRLNKIIHGGGSKKDDFGFEIAGFKESVFSENEWAVFIDAKLENADWVRILFQLGYAESESLNRKYQQIPYGYFTPRQLGSIYESFLEYDLQTADKNMVYKNRQWKPSNLKGDLKEEDFFVKVGELFFSPNNKERKATGSYYTPDYIVQYLTKQSIDSLYENEKKAPDALNVKICDPAMGSGHFLVASLNYLTKLQLANESGANNFANPLQVKLEVLKKCIFGVDVNPRAVKLAKMSLWLETANLNFKLEDLSDQLKVGDSLINDLPGYKLNFSWEKEFPFLKTHGFDLVIGNPPYISMKKFPKSEEKRLIKEHCLEKFKTYSAKSDYFCCFVENFLKGDSNFVKHNGVVSFVLSKSFMSEPSFQDMRNLLWDNSVVSLAIHDPKAFKGVGVKTASLVVRKNKVEDVVTNFYVDDLGKLTVNKNGSCEQSMLEKFGRFVQEPSPENIAILKKIGLLTAKNQNAKLGDVCKHGNEIGLVNGVQTGDNAHWIVEKTKSKEQAENEFKRRGHKKIDVRKYFFGQSVHLFETNWENCWINYCPSEMTKHSSSARPRSFYYDPDHPFFSVKERVLNSFIASDRITCDFDSEGKVLDNNVNMLMPNPEIIGAAELCGILNSELIGKYVLYNLRSNLSVSQSLLMDLPIASLTSAQKSKLKSLVLEAKSEAKNSEKSLQKVMEKIDKLVYDIYGLNQAEVVYIKEFISALKTTDEEEEDAEAA